MRKQFLNVMIMTVAALVFTISCQKETAEKQTQTEPVASVKNNTNETARQAPDPYNLDVDLVGSANSKGDIKFRQDPDPEKIITLDTKIQHLQGNHDYVLQRAVDQTIDGNCTSTAWLTLGLGLTPQSIFTNGGGNGHEELWRDISVAPTGAVFDIHFRIVDAVDNAVVLTSGCYQYTVR